MIPIRVQTGVTLDPDDGLWHIVVRTTGPDGVRTNQYDPGFTTEAAAVAKADQVAADLRRHLTAKGLIR